MCVTKTLAAALLVISMAGHCWGYSSGFTLSCQSVLLPPNQHSPPPSTTSLQCTVQGAEPEGLTIEWTTPNNITLNSTTTQDRLSVYQTDAGSNTTLTGLNVSRLSYDDQGSYQCRVVRRVAGPGTSSTSTLTHSFQLELLTTLNVSIEQPPGESFAELSCEMSDYIQPDGHLSWYHGNQPVDVSDKRKTPRCSQAFRLDAQFGGEKNTHTRVCVLRIEPVMSGDVGTYTCRVGPVVTSQPLTLLEDPSVTESALPAANSTEPTSMQPTPSSPLDILIPVVVVAALLLLLTAAIILVVVIVLVKKCHTKQKHHLFSSSELQDNDVSEAQPSDTATSPNISYGTQPSDTAISPNVSYGTQPCDTATSPNISYGTREPSPDTDLPRVWLQTGEAPGVWPHPATDDDLHPAHTSEVPAVSTDALNGVLSSEVYTTNPNISYGVQPAQGLPPSTTTTQKADGGDSVDPVYESIRSMHHYITARPPDDDLDDDYVNESLGPRPMWS